MLFAGHAWHRRMNMAPTRLLILIFLTLAASARGGAAQEAETVRPAGAEPDLKVPGESIAHAESERQFSEPLSLTAWEPQRPPLQGSRVLGEVAVGAGLGIATTAFLIWAGPVDTCVSDCQGDPARERKRESLTGIVAIGMALGSAAGVTLVGTSGDQTGSFWGAFGGSMIGALTALAASLSAESGGMDIVLATALPALGATVGFNLTRAYQPARGHRSDLAAASGDAPGLASRPAARRWSGPALVITPDPLHPGATIKSLRLVAGEF
jgi:hypothetical protein